MIKIFKINRKHTLNDIKFKWIDSWGTTHTKDIKVYPKNLQSNLYRKNYMQNINKKDLPIFSIVFSSFEASYKNIN